MAKDEQYQEQTKALTPIQKIQKMKSIIAAPSVQEQFKNAMNDNAQLFTASLIELYSGDNYLQGCDPGDVVKEALKAASLKLPINKNLGFAWIVPRKSHGVLMPVMQIGWRGWIQLAQRTGLYKHINVGVVYEGEVITEDRLSGALTFGGEKKSDVAIGYFAYFRLSNGFEKSIYWPKDKMLAHVKHYVPQYNNASNAWSSNFDDMAMKTVISNLVRKWGVLSVEMLNAASDDKAEEDYAREERAEFANSTVIEVKAEPVSEPEPEQEPTQEPQPEQKKEAKVKTQATLNMDPGY